jgi:hypothetical protein
VAWAPPAPPVDEGLVAPVMLHERAQEAMGKVKYVPFLDWSLRVPEPKTGTLDFSRFPFQPAMYEVVGSRTRQVVVRKATQVGVSAMVVRWSIYEADRNGSTVLYVFPTETHVHDFSDARVMPMVEGSDYLLGRAGDPFNKGLKKFGGRGLVYFRGAENKRALDSVDADGLALDEYDTLNQANIPDAERRLSGPLSKGLIRRVGVPSLPQFGIGEKYDESDRRKWLVKCDCGHRGLDAETQEPLTTPRGKGWQEVSFWHNVDQERHLIVCAGCGEPLRVAEGRWVAQQPDSGIIGFHVSRLMVPGVEWRGQDGKSQLDAIIKASQATAPYEIEVFHNKDLGVPYVSKEARLSPEEIAAAQRMELAQVPGYVGPNPVTMGVDVASTRALNVRISELVDEDTKRALFIGTCESFDELALLMERYSVNMAAIDHLPEGRLARAIAERFLGRVYIVSYANQGQQDVIKVDEDQRRASVRHVEALDATIESVRRQRNLLPADLPVGYVAHMTANVRRVERDQLNRPVARWICTRSDDYFQAEVYDLIAGELWWLRQAVDEAQRPFYTRLEDHLEFERSSVTDPESLEYHAGPEADGGSMYLEDDERGGW